MSQERISVSPDQEFANARNRSERTAATGFDCGSTRGSRGRAMSVVALTVSIAAALCLSSCAVSATTGDADVVSSAETETAITPPTNASVEINPSPDKYTWYVKNYVGANAASVGYTSIDGFRRDYYGEGNIRLAYVTNDGTYVNPEDEEQLKDYVVVAQSLAPNTEIKFTFLRDANGEEYSNLIDVQSHEEIVLAVNRVGSAEEAPTLAAIDAAPDKYTRYTRDYVGRNLAACGYLAAAGRLTDQYGHGYVAFDIVADDGSFVDLEDETQVESYAVVAQSVAPNTAISMTFLKNADGEEYDNLIDSQSVDAITLSVTKIS